MLARTSSWRAALPLPCATFPPLSVCTRPGSSRYRVFLVTSDQTVSATCCSRGQPRWYVDISVYSKLYTMAVERLLPCSKRLAMIKAGAHQGVLPMMYHLVTKHCDKLLFSGELSRQFYGATIWVVVGPAFGAVDDRKPAWGKLKRKDIARQHPIPPPTRGHGRLVGLAQSTLEQPLNWTHGTLPHRHSRLHILA